MHTNASAIQASEKEEAQHAAAEKSAVKRMGDAEKGKRRCDQRTTTGLRKTRSSNENVCVCNCIALVSVVSLYTDTIPLQQLQMAVRA